MALASVDIEDLWLPVKLNSTCSIAAFRVSVTNVRKGFNEKRLVPEQLGENSLISLSSFYFKGGLTEGIMLSHNCEISGLGCENSVEAVLDSVAYNPLSAVDWLVPFSPVHVEVPPSVPYFHLCSSVTPSLHILRDFPLLFSLRET